MMAVKENPKLEIGNSGLDLSLYFDMTQGECFAL